MDGLTNVVRAVLLVSVVVRESLLQLARKNIKRSDQVAFSCTVFNVTVLFLFVRERPLESRGALTKFLSLIGHRSFNLF